MESRWDSVTERGSVSRSRDEHLRRVETFREHPLRRSGGGSQTRAPLIAARDSVSRSASECEEATANFEAAVLAKRLRVANPRSAGESAEGGEAAPLG